jgi:signal transduction histidine kinase
MSYRTFKRVLGESSLERKCRFLFGASLLLLIVGSFIWYGRATNALVYENTRSNCRYLAGSAVLLKPHFKMFAAPIDSEEEHQRATIIDEIENLTYKSKFLSLEPVEIDLQPKEQPPVEVADDNWELTALRRLKEEYDRQVAELQAAPNRPRQTPSAADQATMDPAVATVIYETFKDEKPIETDLLAREAGEFQYYQAVRWKAGCVICHLDRYGITPPDTTRPSEENASLLPFVAVKIALPYENTQRAINKNYAILLATAIITVFFSMIALYIVVRYVIVKPLHHLQSVSEEVERGNHAARAQIETNDEFEELARAFNRMLHHLVEAQRQLSDANVNLDAKVDQLAQANMQLYEMNRVKGDFLANVSHELRTPLNSIIGFADVLRNIDSLSEKQKRYASNISSSGRVLLDLINDILDLAKMESGRTQVEPSEFSIEALVRAQCDAVRSLTDEKNIDLEVRSPECLPKIYQDRAKVQQILTNLLSNAIKFTPEGGRVEVRIGTLPPGNTTEPTWLLLTVQDTGIGVADEDRDVIFEKFRQANATRGSDNLTREFSGTGLGLSIVKELCRLLGGEIQFKSQLGQGSAFTIRLPWILATAADAPEEELIPGVPVAKVPYADHQRDQAPLSPRPGPDMPSVDTSPLASSTGGRSDV